MNHLYNVSGYAITSIFFDKVCTILKNHGFEFSYQSKGPSTVFWINKLATYRLAENGIVSTVVHPY